MKKMNSAEMSNINGGAISLFAVALGWFIGRTAVCGFKGLFKC